MPYIYFYMLNHTDKSQVCNEYDTKIGLGNFTFMFYG